MKNRTALFENWGQKKAPLKEQFAILKDSDLELILGKEDELFKLLQFKLGRTDKDLRMLIESL